MILLENYETARPVINFDHASGTWRKATDEEAPPEKPIVRLQNVVGSYLFINNTYYFSYWVDAGTPIERYYFRTSEDVLIEIDGHNYAEVDYATDTAGNPQREYKQFSIYREDGQLLYRIIYCSLDYEKRYEYDSMTCDVGRHIFDPPTLATWDWFVAKVESFRGMKERRLEREKEAALLPPSPTPAPPVLSAAPGSVCPKEGVWFAPHLRMKEIRMKQGETFPTESHGPTGAVTWYYRDGQDLGAAGAPGAGV